MGNGEVLHDGKRKNYSWTSRAFRPGHPDSSGPELVVGFGEG